MGRQTQRWWLLGLGSAAALGALASPDGRLIPSSGRVLGPPGRDPPPRRDARGVVEADPPALPRRPAVSYPSTPSRLACSPRKKRQGTLGSGFGRLQYAKRDPSKIPRLLLRAKRQGRRRPLRYPGGTLRGHAAPTVLQNLAARGCRRRGGAGGRHERSSPVGRPEAPGREPPASS